MRTTFLQYSFKRISPAPKTAIDCIFHLPSFKSVTNMHVIAIIKASTPESLYGRLTTPYSGKSYRPTGNEYYPLLTAALPLQAEYCRVELTRAAIKNILAKMQKTAAKIWKTVMDVNRRFDLPSGEDDAIDDAYNFYVNVTNGDVTVRYRARDLAKCLRVARDMDAHTFYICPHRINVISGKLGVCAIHPAYNNTDTPNFWGAESLLGDEEYEQYERALRQSGVTPESTTLNFRIKGAFDMTPDYTSISGWTEQYYDNRIKVLIKNMSNVIVNRVINSGDELDDVVKDLYCDYLDEYRKLRPHCSPDNDITYQDCINKAFEIYYTKKQ